MARLAADHLWLQYTNRRTGLTTVALRDITLAIDDGEFVSIVGPSGCGKTTFLRIVAGLLAPTAGRVALDGRPVSAPGPHLGFVFQNPLLFPWRSVLGNIAYGPELAHTPKTAARARAAELARLVGLAGFEHAYPHELSGGMQQRVNLARALALNPGGLLLDEPFSALDAQTREFMQEELQRIWWETKKTALLVTHQIGEAIYLADRVIIFTSRPGHVKEDIPVDLPRPRPLDIKRTAEFRAIEDRVWALIEDEFRRTWRREAAAISETA